ncbi:10869_t:CDS:1, partial [Cetraspora pellucida]
MPPITSSKRSKPPNAFVIFRTFLNDAINQDNKKFKASISLKKTSPTEKVTSTSGLAKDLWHKYLLIQNIYRSLYNKEFVDKNHGVCSFSVSGIFGNLNDFYCELSKNNDPNSSENKLHELLKRGYDYLLSPTREKYKEIVREQPRYSQSSGTLDKISSKRIDLLINFVTNKINLKASFFEPFKSKCAFLCNSCKVELNLDFLYSEMFKFLKNKSELPDNIFIDKIPDELQAKYNQISEKYLHNISSKQQKDQLAEYNDISNEQEHMKQSMPFTIGDYSGLLAKEFLSNLRLRYPTLKYYNDCYKKMFGEEYAEENTSPTWLLKRLLECLLRKKGYKITKPHYLYTACAEALECNKNKHIIDAYKQLSLDMKESISYKLARDTLSSAK